MSVTGIYAQHAYRDIAVSPTVESGAYPLRYVSFTAPVSLAIKKYIDDSVRDSQLVVGLIFVMGALRWITATSFFQDK